MPERRAVARGLAVARVHARQPAVQILQARVLLAAGACVRGALALAVVGGPALPVGAEPLVALREVHGLAARGEQRSVRESFSKLRGAAGAHAARARHGHRDRAQQIAHLPLPPFVLVLERERLHAVVVARDDGLRELGGFERHVARHAAGLVELDAERDRGGGLVGGDLLAAFALLGADAVGEELVGLGDGDLGLVLLGVVALGPAPAAGFGRAAAWWRRGRHDVMREITCCGSQLYRSIIR